MKILVGCVTYDGHSTHLEKLISTLKKINQDVIFVDTSVGDNYANLLREKGFEVLKYIPKEEERIERIVEGRNMIRKYFLEKDYDYLFFLDTDVVPPDGVIEKLLECDTDIATGVYLCNQQIRNERKILPIIYEIYDKDKVRIPAVKEMVPERIYEIAVCGLGCCLIKKEVLEKIAFRQFSHEKEVQDDVAFCVDSRKAGFKIKVNTAVKCDHIVKLFGEYKVLSVKNQL